MSRLAYLCAAVVTFVFAFAIDGGTETRAGRVRTWTERPADLARGRAEGLALSRSGRLFPAPRLTRVDGSGPSARPAQIWAMTPDPSGNLYLGTGPDGLILRIGRTGMISELYSIAEPMVNGRQNPARCQFRHATAKPR